MMIPGALYLAMPKCGAALLAALGILCLSAPQTVSAQGETTSAIAGLVADETSSAIPDANVSVVSEETGQKRSLKTDDAGRFSFPQLKPGTYVVEASASQFQSQRRSAVTAPLGRTQMVNFTLGIQSIREDVTVNAEAAPLNTQNPNTSTTLNARVLEDLPN